MPYGVGSSSVVFAALNEVTITGSNGEQDLSGAYADRPAATAVPAGTTYWSIDQIGQANEFSVSTGSAWTNI